MERNSNLTYQKHLLDLNYFETNEGRMAYIDKGEGEVILLLHGVPTSSWLYRHIILILVKRGFRVIAPDMIGYGASEKPDGYDIYSDEYMGQRLLGLMNQLKIDQWTHVFHDGGGLWTWAMLKQDASKVKQLIMLNTIVYRDGFNPPMKFNEGLIAKIYTRLYSLPFVQSFVINPTLRNGLKNKSLLNKQMLEGYKIPLLNFGHHGLYYFFTQTCQTIIDYTALHQSLSLPLTVIWGKYDDVLVWEKNAEQIKRNFKMTDDDIHLLEAKHFIQEECPDIIAEIINMKCNKSN